MTREEIMFHRINARCDRIEALDQSKHYEQMGWTGERDPLPEDELHRGHRTRDEYRRDDNIETDWEGGDEPQEENQ